MGQYQTVRVEVVQRPARRTGQSEADYEAELVDSDGEPRDFARDTLYFRDAKVGLRDTSELDTRDFETLLKEHDERAAAYRPRLIEERKAFRAAYKARLAARRERAVKRARKRRAERAQAEEGGPDAKRAKPTEPDSDCEASGEDYSDPGEPVDTAYEMASGVDSDGDERPTLRIHCSFG